MKDLKYFFIINLLFSVLLFNSCKDEDPVEENDEEVITTLTYTLTPTSGDAVTLSFSDLDGEGGNAPIVTGGTLQANMNYTGVLDLRNDAENPAENITLEIEAEKEDHQFFFPVSENFNLTVSYNDQDALGKPVGLSTNLTTGDISSGTLTVILRHKPEKDESGVSDGDVTNAGGETDIEVVFDVDIQ